VPTRLYIGGLFVDGLAGGTIEVVGGEVPDWYGLDD
jgi:hypothetical protein